MNSTTTPNLTTRSETTPPPESGITAYNIALIIIYTTVLTVGSIGVTLMIGVLKSNLRSWTTVTFFNLILVHVIFMVTIPFRIYYSVTNDWGLGMFFCKVVSSTIHIHMHVVFIIYVIILTVHFLHYFRKMEQIELNRSLHALGFSIGVWMVVLIVCPVTLSYYGMHANESDHKCFNFGDEMKGQVVYTGNIFLSVCTIILSCIMSCVLAAILYSMIKKHGASAWAHHEFWAQMKNVSLVMIILFCLAPYHVYRIYYLSNISNHQDVNEVFLAATSITCFDMMFVFAGKGICHRCGG